MHAKRVCAACAFFALAGAASADVVIEWNRVMSDVLASNTTEQNPGMASRTSAMVNIAMYDAINSIDPRHELFYSHAPGPADASLEAAACHAAYHVLSAIYPDQQAYLDAELASYMSVIPDGPSKDSGITQGTTVGQLVLDEREDDGYDVNVQFIPTGETGHWEPDPMNPDQEAWGPGWGDIETFALTSSQQIPVPPMPDLTSQQYADAFNEVKELGALNSTTRTAEQTEIGIFWAYDRLGMGTPMRLYNQALRVVAVEQGNTLHENARLFAMASVALADAGAVAWDSKYFYDLWRPISGIRRADEDANPDTVADPSWIPLGAPGGIGPDGEVIDDFTPPFPTYLSGHATFGGAVFGSLMEFYGTDDVSFELTSAELPGVVRQFDSFSEAMHENGRSRVYLGIHWEFDDTVAQSTGRTIAGYVAANHFLPIPTCDADLDGNGSVAVPDVSYVIFRLGDSGTPGSLEGDVNGDGVVNVADLVHVISSFGSCP